ncbi:lachesin-like, partial [Saccostrea cucullata]|uniref:lachesin-like n=1 Tax=Saccostrea cuccullata TaxID=36930 RepID=UPI002ED2B87D
MVTYGQQQQTGQQTYRPPPSYGQQQQYGQGYGQPKGYGSPVEFSQGSTEKSTIAGTVSTAASFTATIGNSINFTSTYTLDSANGANSYVVMMRVNEVVCSDEKHYRCSVLFISTTLGPITKTQETSLTARVKVNVPTIRKLPDTGVDSQYSVGSSVTMTCQAEGNPTPGIHTNKTVNRYQWTFKASPNDNTTELSSVNGTLTLTNLQETDTGTYTCTAFNGFNGKFFNASNSVKLHI